MSMATEKKLDHLNWPLALCTAVICALGVWNLASATKSLPDPLWAKQAVMMGLGVVAIGIFLFIDYRWLQTLAWPGYFAALALLAGGATGRRMSKKGRHRSMMPYCPFRAPVSSRLK